MIPVLDCDAWGGNCSQCLECQQPAHSKWNLEWWYYAFMPVADAVDRGDIGEVLDERIGYVRGITLYSAQNLTNEHTVFGYKPTKEWPGINTSLPVQFYSGIQIHICLPVRGCYSINYQLGANYTANDTHWRHWSDDMYITNDTFKLKIDCGSFYNYNYATDKFDGPCADIELHNFASSASQPEQNFTNSITDSSLATGSSNVAWFPYSLNSQTTGKLKIWNYKMPDDGYYGHGETITLVDYDEHTSFRTYWGHTFGSRSGYNSGIKNWLWLYAQNMTCLAECRFGDMVDVVVGGQFGPADFSYIDGALRRETFVALDMPYQSDAKAVRLPDGRRAIQITQGMSSHTYDGQFQFSCAADRFTPYSANRFTYHATLCTATVWLRVKSRVCNKDPSCHLVRNSTYTTSLGLLELDRSWLLGVGLLNETKAGPYPSRPYLL